MYRFKYFVSICVVLVLVLPNENEVSAAPHPCLWMLDHEYTHPVPTTTTSKPDLVEDLAKLTKKKTKQLKDLADFIIWGPNTEVRKPRSRSPMEKVISSYVKFLTNVIKMF
ncbi:hypothetical protein B5X24_HaOG216509 [Helicoverpa armigera]|nr:hypothetical protein B5X24_HaOG216509 [Helicoverpa armigera]